MFCLRSLPRPFLPDVLQVRMGSNPAWGQIHWSVIAAALLVPIGFALPQIGFLPHYDHVTVEKDIQKLQEAVSDVAADGTEKSCL